VWRRKPFDLIAEWINKIFNILLWNAVGCGLTVDRQRQSSGQIHHEIGKIQRGVLPSAGKERAERSPHKEILQENA
jgi:hypothetical protein